MTPFSDDAVPSAGPAPPNDPLRGACHHSSIPPATSPPAATPEYKTLRKAVPGMRYRLIAKNTGPDRAYGTV